MHRYILRWEIDPPPQKPQRFGQRGKRWRWSKKFDERAEAIEFAAKGLPAPMESPRDGGRYGQVTLEREISTSFVLDFGRGKMDRIWKRDESAGVVAARPEILDSLPYVNTKEIK